VIVPSFAERHETSSQETFATSGSDWSRQKISFVMVFGSSGQLVAVEDLPNYPLIKRTEKLMTVPRIQGSPDGPPVNFLWDRTAFAIGVSKDLRTAPGYRINHEAFACFRVLHAVALEGVADTAVQAFLKFLARWSPEQFLQALDFREKLDLNLAFRFQYDDEFLHERHAARLAWRRISTALRDAPVAQQSQVCAALRLQPTGPAETTASSANMTENAQERRSA
jgi:CRISPR-associated protein Csd1